MQVWQMVRAWRRGSCMCDDVMDDCTLMMCDVVIDDCTLMMCDDVIDDCTLMMRIGAVFVVYVLYTITGRGG